MQFMDENEDETGRPESEATNETRPYYQILKMKHVAPQVGR